ncbi:MAG: ATP-binding cassette domain-containing protein [Oscillospiraceae bacterium]|nr:ATP-binding cassette domain-containing protein [Oscillospiraceae bacterium]
MGNIIELKNICKSFGDHQIFKDFNLEIPEGDFVCITGESGKGKTTLLNIIGMLEPQDSGSLILDGVVDPRLNSRAGRKLIRNSLFYVFQNYGLVEDRTVKYNLEVSAYFMNPKPADAFETALKNVGLDPDFLNKKIYTLSGGEQQRCALARMYLKQHKIVLADEPTGSLDEMNRDRVMDIFKRVHESGKTVVLVTHDQEVAKCANRIVQL